MFLYFYPNTSYYISVEDSISSVVVGFIRQKIIVSKLYYLYYNNPTKLIVYSTSSFISNIKTITYKAMFLSRLIEFVKSNYYLSRESTLREDIKRIILVAEKSKISKPKVTFT